MNVKSILKLALGVLIFALTPIQAANLLEVYYQALHSDPTFKKAEATWQSEKENLPIARSGYLPQVTLGGNLGRDFQESLPAPLANSGNGFRTRYGYNVSVTQPLFNAVNWERIRGASYEVKAATATFSNAAQDLMVRVITAYFDVMRAYDKLRFTIANKRAVRRQLTTAEQKFKVGLIAITGVYDAQSVYDQAVANEITDRNELYNALEELRAITGIHYRILSGIRKQVPLMTPQPNNIHTWVSVAVRQNYDLKAQEYTVLADHKKIAETQAGRLPTLDLEASYTDADSIGIPGIGNTSLRLANFGVTMNFPVIQGGLVFASSSQARYDYLAASSELVFVHRDVVSQTRQAFLGVISGISQVKADLQAIKSAKNALEATRAGYIVGTRTMVDVLNDLTRVYEAQNSYADDQYNYLTNMVDLKSDAGMLSEKDVAQLSRILSKSVKFHLPKKFYGKARQVYSDNPQYKYMRDYLERTKLSYKKMLKNAKKARTRFALRTEREAKLHKRQLEKQRLATLRQKKLRQKKMREEKMRALHAKFMRHHYRHLRKKPAHKERRHEEAHAKAKYAVRKLPAPKHAHHHMQKKQLAFYQYAASQLGKRFTIQLYASDKRSEAVRFILAQKTKLPYKIVKEHDLYKVVVGDYHDHLQAKAALHRLPKLLQSSHPWVLALPLG